MKSFSIILFLIFVFGQQTAFGGVWTKKRMKVDEDVSSSVEEVLKLTADFHSTRIKKNQKESLEVATEISSKLGQIAELTRKHRTVQNVHITKILNSAKSSLESYAQAPLSKNAIIELKDFFKDIVQVTQVFEVKKYQIFFCPADKALWLQLGNKAKNPVSLSLSNCGKRI